MSQHVPPPSTFWDGTSTGSALQEINELELWFSRTHAHTHTHTHTHTHARTVTSSCTARSLIYTQHHHWQSLRICQVQFYLEYTGAHTEGSEGLRSEKEERKEEENKRKKRRVRNGRSKREIKGWSSSNLIYNLKSLPLELPHPLNPIGVLFYSDLTFPLSDVEWSLSLHNQGDMSGRSLCDQCDFWLAPQGGATPGNQALRDLIPKDDAEIGQLLEVKKFNV